MTPTRKPRNRNYNRDRDIGQWSGGVWTVVLVLAAIALIIFILPHIR